ncbi:MAG TPA: DsrE family protein [Gammaproteobacteria bacterium]|nr:DsrE family protein [Gammaproteobacteria bacterium]
MKVVISVTHGTDDPTQATLGILAAKAAADQGHDVTVWLQGEGAVLANKSVYPHVQGVNMPPMKDAVEALVAKGVPLWVCKACGAARGVSEETWVATASYKTMGDFVAAALESDKNIDF